MLHFPASMIEARRTPAFPSRARPRPWLAALLSFLFPGMGQAYGGAIGLALVFAAPVLVLIVLVVAVLSGVAGNLGNGLLSTRFLTGVLVLDAALLLWRAAAIIHGGLALRPTSVARRERTVTLGTVGALLLLTVAMHAWVGITVLQLEGTLSQVFGGTRAEPAPGAPQSGDPEPAASPGANWDGKEPITVLLLGTDAAPGRDAVLTDVVMVLSVDPVAESAVMISIPRDTGYVPLPDGSVYPDGLFPEKINELVARASRDPDTWCPEGAATPETCGLRVMESAIGTYLGVKIDHYALVDMAGFAEMIDALGGLELCLPGQLVDPEFDGTLGNNQRDGPLILPAGCNHYDGLDALAYARSRKGWIEMPDGTRELQNDFARADRQQRVLLALRDELAQANTLLELPGVLSAIGRTVSTDFPREQAGDLATLLPLITGPSIDRVVLGYPDYVDLPVNPDVNYLLIPNRDAIRTEMARIFGRSALIGWYVGSRDPGPDLSSEANAETP